MALQPARQIFSRPHFLLYQRGAVSQISLAGPPVLLKTMPFHLSVVRLPTPLQKIAGTESFDLDPSTIRRRVGSLNPKGWTMHLTPLPTGIMTNLWLGTNDLHHQERGYGGMRRPDKAMA